MSLAQAVPSVPNPTMMLKRPDVESMPDVAEVSDVNFRKYVYTGIKAIINTPLVKDSPKPILAVNVDGFIPTLVFANSRWGSMMRNLFPVQRMKNSLGLVKVVQENFMIPQLMAHYSHRVVGGKVNIGMRITSNTSQSGNLFISQGTALTRQYYTPTENYDGLRFLNSSGNTNDFGVDNFAIVDLSLNRQISIKPTRREQLHFTDLARKIANSQFHPTTGSAIIAQIREANTFSTQFAEDWIFVGLLSDLPASTANQVTISFFFDFSEIQYMMPLYPVIPMGSNDPTQNALDYGANFDGKPSINKGDIVWLY